MPKLVKEPCERSPNILEEYFQSVWEAFSVQLPNILYAIIFYFL